MGSSVLGSSHFRGWKGCFEMQVCILSPSCALGISLPKNSDGECFTSAIRHKVCGNYHLVPARYINLDFYGDSDENTALTLNKFYHDKLEKFYSC